MMRQLATDDPHVVAINLSRNHGHQLALTAGLDLCRGETILIIDADLQDPPELLPAMLEAMSESDTISFTAFVRAGGATQPLRRRPRTASIASSHEQRRSIFR